VSKAAAVALVRGEAFGECMYSRNDGEWWAILLARRVKFTIEFLFCS
jgi:hypothetical protein